MDLGEVMGGQGGFREAVCSWDMCSEEQRPSVLCDERDPSPAPLTIPSLGAGAGACCWSPGEVCSEEQAL